ncbi:MAG: UvrD-helicase domain-containing protein [Actinomycetota bacterium]
MRREPARELAETRRGYLIAAAGCGKTQTVCEAASLHDDGRQLILTHTHAGVKAVRTRLGLLNVPARKVVVGTIAGFALRYASRYPRLSGLEVGRPSTSDEWSAVYEAATRLAMRNAVRRVLTESYAGLYVDEYQDCDLRQHALVLALADVLPCRVVGDPMQAIFRWQASVEWDRDVDSNFQRLDDLDTPWRWVGTNPGLGEWLVGVRTELAAGRSIDLTTGPTQWSGNEMPNKLATCHRVANLGGSVVAIGNRAADCHSFARKMKGRYTSMEEIECRDLVKHAGLIEGASGPARSVAVIDFAKECLTKVGTELGGMRMAFSRGDIPIPRVNTKHPAVLAALTAVATDDSHARVLDAMGPIESIEGTVVARRELWGEMRRAIRCREAGTQPTLPDAAWYVRDAWRHGGRRVDDRTISRTLLVKGLEFDHAIVLDAGAHDSRNIYVALTRGAVSLSVLAESPTLIPRAESGSPSSHPLVAG